MHTRETVKSQLLELIQHHRSVNIDILITTIPAWGLLHTKLNADEIIKGYCIGQMENNTPIYKNGKWLVVVTNKKLHILHKALIGNLVHHSTNLDEIIKTEFKRKWLNGGFKINSPKLNVEFYLINKSDLNNFENGLNSFHK